MNRRSKKVASLIRGELAKILMEETSSPALQGISVTEVALTDDLKHARVYYTHPMSSVPENEVKTQLKKAVPFFKRLLGQNLDLRCVPDLIFEKDDHMDGLNRVLTLIDQVSLGENYPQ